MQIELLETFLDLAQTRSFNRTAERLGLTQSTVSSRVAALEVALGSKLFNRSRAGTELTSEGVKFEPHARSLLHEWNEASRRLKSLANGSQTVKMGIQNDLAGQQIGEWVAGFRRALPDMSFYIEPDYSAQMCADLLTGTHDFAVMFTAKPHPDIHFTSVGDVGYKMVSSYTNLAADLVRDNYVFAHFSPAFEQMHRQIFPHLSQAPLSVGQSATVSSLLRAMGGAGYVLERTAKNMIETGHFLAVDDAPLLRQPVYAATHLRHRISPMHRHLLRVVQRHLDERSG